MIRVGSKKTVLVTLMALLALVVLIAPATAAQLS